MQIRFISTFYWVNNNFSQIFLNFEFGVLELGRRAPILWAAVKFSNYEILLDFIIIFIYKNFESCLFIKDCKDLVFFLNQVYYSANIF